MQYFVIDQQGRRYGPATIDTLNAWIREGRLNVTSIVEEASTGKRIQLNTLVREATLFVLHGSNVNCEFSLPAELWRTS